MNFSDLVVKDQEFNTASERFKAFHEVLRDAVGQYRVILTDASNNAVSSGKVHDAMVVYLEYVKKLEEVVEGLEGKLAIIVKDYITELERADDYLYDAGISDVARDFTQERYEHLMSCLDDPWCSITDSFGDWIYDNILKIIDFFNLDSVKADLNNCHRLLLDYNDETKDGLYQLFTSVHSIDSDYGASISGGSPGGGDFYTSHFSWITLTLCCIRDMIDEMAEIIRPGSNAFSVQQINDRLGKAYKELMHYYDETVDICKRYDPPTIIEISDFASQPWATAYFSAFQAPISDYIADIGNWETFKMIVFNMFGISLDNLIHSGDGKLSPAEMLAILRGDIGFLAGSNLGQEVASGNGYEVYIAKKQLLSVLDEMSESYKYSGSDEKEFVDKCNTYLKYFEKYGDKWYEKLDGRTKEAKRFKSFLESLDNAQAILKYGNEAIDYIARLFADYSAGLDVIESFDKNYSGDEVMSEAVDEIRNLYNKEFSSWTEEAFNKISKLGYDAAIKEISKAVPIVAVVSAIEESIDLVGKLTGLGTEAQSMYDSLIYHQLYSSSYSAYNHALAELRLLQEGTEEYTQAAEDLKNCFDLHKTNTIELFKSMAGASTGDKKAYYKYCAKQAELMTMKSDGAPDILTFEEFCALA